MSAAYKYLPGEVGNEERELFMVSEGGRTRRDGRGLRKGEIFCLAIKKVPCSRAMGSRRLPGEGAPAPPAERRTRH